MPDGTMHFVPPRKDAWIASADVVLTFAEEVAEAAGHTNEKDFWRTVERWKNDANAPEMLKKVCWCILELRTLPLAKSGLACLVAFTLYLLSKVITQEGDEPKPTNINVTFNIYRSSKPADHGWREYQKDAAELRDQIRERHRKHR